MPSYIPGQKNSFFEELMSVFEDEHHGRHAQIVQEGLSQAIEEGLASYTKYGYNAISDFRTKLKGMQKIITRLARRMGGAEASFEDHGLPEESIKKKALLMRQAVTALEGAITKMYESDGLLGDIQRTR